MDSKKCICWVWLHRLRGPQPRAAYWAPSHKYRLRCRRNHWIKQLAICAFRLLWPTHSPANPHETVHPAAKAGVVIRGGKRKSEQDEFWHEDKFPPSASYCSSRKARAQSNALANPTALRPVELKRWGPYHPRASRDVLTALVWWSYQACWALHFRSVGQNFNQRSNRAKKTAILSDHARYWDQECMRTTRSWELEADLHVYIYLYIYTYIHTYIYIFTGTQANESPS